MDQKTIYALSTVFGKSGVAVVRISGNRALDAVSRMTTVNTLDIKPRYAYFCKIFHALTHEILDHALVLYFKAPHSFTGEDVVEIQCHGSKAVLNSVLSSLSELEDFRLAEPGEFSKRAFLNHKMDLTEAEGLADLIDSETAEQQKYALRQMEGNLRNLYENWRENLLKVYAYLEAYIDFPDEDIDPEVEKIISSNINTLISEIRNHLDSSQGGERLREGFRVAIVGPANAGKSSLLNALVHRQAAIVSDIAGTTRDAIDIYLDIAGYPVIFTDTAGYRQATDEIERQGIEIACDKMKDADLILAVFDAAHNTPEDLENFLPQNRQNVIWIANKSDLISTEQKNELIKKDCVFVAAKFNEGVTALTNEIGRRISETFTASSNLLITRARYTQALQNTLENLERFHLNKEIELSAEDVRLAAREIGKITGQIEVDEVLDKIFGSFCIGK